MINRNNITCGYETCISGMLLQYYLKKWRLRKLARFEFFYLNAELTRILQLPKKYYDE